MIELYDSKGQGLHFLAEKIFLDFELGKYKKVFIKPNLGGRYPIIKGENTRYDILDAFCGILEDNDCQEVVIGHSSLLNFEKSKYDFKTLIKKSGFYRLSKYSIVKFLDLDSSSRFTVKVRDINFNIPEITKSHFYINLCNLKTHMETTVSLSMKNQVGLLTAEERKRKHQSGLDIYIAYLAAAVRPGLNILDGRVGMEGNGPHHGNPKRADIILCGDDMIEVDSLACSLIGIDFESVKHIRFAIEENAGRPVQKDKSGLYRQYSVQFAKPNEFYKKYNVKVWPNEACSGCIFNLSDAYKTIRKNPIYMLQFIARLIKAGKIDIILGKGAEVNLERYSRKILTIGNCTRDFAKANNIYNFISGCPPFRKDVINFLIAKDKKDTK